MDNTTLGTTSLEHIPQELLNPKRKTNRVWTLLLIVVIVVFAYGFWQHRQDVIQKQVQEVVPVTPQNEIPQPMSMSDIEQSLADTEIPSFHETL